MEGEDEQDKQNSHSHNQMQSGKRSLTDIQPVTVSFEYTYANCNGGPEGKKESAVLEAEAEKQAAILKADAEKQKRILEAEGEAQAILKVQNATAEGIKLIKEAGADQSVLTLKSLEAFAAAADGQATKIIIPSDIQGLAGSVKAITEVIKD